MVKLTLIRGLPGSGKSTLAKALGGEHFEADMWFMHGGDKYVFDARELGAAHGWCQASVRSALAEGKDVVVSNTFTTIKELRPYFDIARAYDVVPTIILAQNQFKNLHGVPDDKLQAMRDRFVYDLTPLFEGAIE
jgi:predicted kinase